MMDEWAQASWNNARRGFHVRLDSDGAATVRLVA
jgi:hypothetical protein